MAVRLLRRQTAGPALKAGPKVPEEGRPVSLGIFFVLAGCSRWERGESTCPDLQS